MCKFTWTACRVHGLVSRNIFTFFILSGCVWGQIHQATLTGTVSDPSGLPVQNAAVDVLFAATGLSRTTRTGSAGTYAITALPPGSCRVTVRAPGLQSLQIGGVTLAVGEIRTLDAVLAIESVSAALEVEAETGAALERSSVALGGLVTETQVGQLPLNGRNWTNLMTLAPGATNTGTGDQISIRFMGHGLDDNEIRFDGVDATGILRQSQKAEVRLQVSTDSIAEFRVNVALYQAEYGGVAGGQIDVISKSGADDWHGSLFEYIRNDRLDARSPFDPSSLPPFRLNQFGGNVGGALVKDRSFIFVNYEGLRQTLGQTLTGFVPSDAFRSALISGSPRLRQFVNAYPEGTSHTSSPDIDSWAGSGRQIQNEDSGLIRFDQRFSSTTTGFVRWNIDGAVLSAPLGDGSGYLRDILQSSDRPQNGVAQLTHVFSETMVNQIKAGVNRVPFTAQNRGEIPEALTVPGFTTLNNNLEQVQNSTSYSAADTLSLVRGRHNISLGLGQRRVEINLSNTVDNTYIFASLADFLTDKLNEADLLAPVPTSGVRKTDYSGFVQDEFKVSSSLTLNLGLRYEYFGVFSEVKGRARAFDPATCGGFCPVGSSFYNPDLLDLGPRLGLAWAPKRFKGKTVFRTGGGLFYGEGQLGDLTGPLNNITSRITFTSAQIPALTYPVDPFVALGASIGNQPRALARDRRNERIAQWGFTMQQELPLRATLEISYTGNKGTHMFSRSYTNAIDPATGERPLPQFSLLDYKSMDRNSNFNALVVGLHRRYRAGWLVGADYTWSHAIDDGSTGGGESDYPENIQCVSCERASSDQDIRHNLTASAVYEWKGWKFAAIGTARTGRPLTVTVTRSASNLPDGNDNYQRPDLIPGVSLIPPGGSTANLWINPAAFTVPPPGEWGNAGRNLVRAPGIWQADASMSRSVRLKGDDRVEFRAEVFNIFNRAQLGEPGTNLSAPGSFGRITQPLNPGATGTGTPRQFQLVVRFGF
jgi:hypothetical protein